jgi:GH25 family lysozyme M1 (1,4-beta-N-acetylmuramidase)
MTAWIQEFMDEYQAQTGRTPMIYCGQLWWSYCVDESDFSEAPLWVASWDDASPNLPAGWSDYDIWQYGATEVEGIEVEADINVFHGSEARLGKLADNKLP